ncbi:MAG: hypothetical protein R6V36_05675, partial [Psychroflexus sp.]
RRYARRNNLAGPGSCLREGGRYQNQFEKQDRFSRNNRPEQKRPQFRIEPEEIFQSRTKNEKQQAEPQKQQRPFDQKIGIELLDKML